MDPADTEATRLLRRIEAGDRDAQDDLLALLHAHLRDLAGRMMAEERADHTLQPTALVHEAWMRLAKSGARAEDRRHFLRLAGRAMRRVLVDHARARGRVKRGEGRTQVAIEEARDAWDRWQGANVDVLALDEVLERLEQHDEDLARVVELRFFAGLTLAETAAAVGTTEEGVRWSWRLARAWLKRELERDGAREG